MTPRHHLNDPKLILRSSLGILLLEEERGAKHSPQGLTGYYVMINVEKCDENHDFLMISENHR